jgi:DNA polymerase/3'-5' exonuclease PolX
MTPIDRLRQKVKDRDYFLSSHAEDEMVDDLLERRDVEQAILKGRIEKVMTHDERGIRYRVEGATMDDRFTSSVDFAKTAASLSLLFTPLVKMYDL